MAADRDEIGSPWDALRDRLQDRLVMAREVLDEQGYGDVAALVPIEEVLAWMDEIEAEQSGRSGDAS